MDSIRRTVEYASRFLASISKISVAAMVTLVTINVIFRKTPIGGITGTYEITGYLGGIAIALALGYNQVFRENIHVELLVSHFSEKSQAVIECINHFIATLLYWTIAFSCFKGGIMLWERSEVSVTLSLPLLPFYFIIGIGCFFLGVVLLTDFFKSIREVLNK